MSSQENASTTVARPDAQADPGSVDPQTGAVADAGSPQVVAPGTLVAGQSPRARARRLSPSGVGVVVAFLVTVAVFVILRPDTFEQWQTWQGILEASAVPAVIAMGLTIALIVGDFDLSIGAVLGLGMGVCVSLTAEHRIAWPLAILIALAVCAAVGVVNGVLVTRARVNSFIGTLAMGSVVGGIEAKVTDQKTISNGLPQGFIDFGAARPGGISLGLWIAILLGVVLFVVVRHTEVGRYFYAVGSNQEAARLAGVRVKGLRTSGFVIAAVAAGGGGVILASQTVSYYPNAGTGYLLPAYAAAFLGTALGGGRFGILATAFGVLFLQTLQTGLTVINIPPWVVLLTQGLVLVAAVLLSGASDVLSWSRRGRRRTAHT